MNVKVIDFQSPCYLGEEGVEAVVSAPHSLVRRHAAIRLNAVLQAVELPASVANLDTGLRIDRNYKVSSLNCLHVMLFPQTRPGVSCSYKIRDSRMGMTSRQSQATALAGRTVR